MKELAAGVVLLLVIGIGGFLYRNMLEHPTPAAIGTPVACTAEAKLCPDGSSVARSGPQCEFATCALPNAEDSVIGISFVFPKGYTPNTGTIGVDETLRAVFTKASKGEVPNTIKIRRFVIPTGKTANGEMLVNTRYESSGNGAIAMSEFKTKVVGGKTFYCAQLERFEGQIHTVCYFPRTIDVLRFEILEKDVDWTNPKLVVETLPEHMLFYAMLGTLQSQ